MRLLGGVLMFVMAAVAAAKKADKVGKIDKMGSRSCQKEQTHSENFKCLFFVYSNRRNT